MTPIRFYHSLPKELLVADGATGTMLQARGLQRGEPSEIWNLTRPEVIRALHSAYLAVGCDLVTTNTFGANRLRLKETGLEGQVEAINRMAVRLARESGSNGHLVGGSVGPTGYFRQEEKRGSVAEIRSAFEEQISHLIQAAVDLLVIETMTHLEEAAIALQATENCPPCPVAVSLVFFKTQTGLTTRDGASPQEATRQLAAAQTVGCNCVDVQMVGEILQQMRDATNLPLVAQPHAGLPVKQETQVVYPLTPEAMARHIPSLLKFKVGILGGCCGTTPAHLEAVIHSLRHS
ncbi:MAG: homocysteine S-methyltransferase family protein [candidate division NC10 bacterium]|nr:homocysteine S-methyltransferase family protein [candidate division NC10 bacterium]